MEIEQSFTVPYPRDAVWAHFRDTPEIVACLPGASLTAPVENGMLKLAMTVKLGPIVASFAGDGEMALDDDNHRGSITGTGVDRKSASRVKGVAAFSLAAPTAAQTRVDVKVDYTIGGSLAQFSRGGIVRELATRMTEAFANNLKTRLDAAQLAVIASPVAPIPGVEATACAPAQADDAAVALADGAPSAASRTASNAGVTRPASATSPAVGASAPAAPAPRVPAPSAPLDVGNLFWKMIWTRLRGMFGLGAR